MLTYHGVSEPVWREQAGAPQYLPEGFAAEGFIHTSPDPASLADSLNRHCTGDPRPYLALVIDLDRVAAPWQLSHHPGLAVDFPHIHGPLNRDAVTGVVDVPRAADGRFTPPTNLDRG